MGIVLKKKSQGEPDESYRANAIRAASLADEKLAKDIKAYDVAGLTSVTEAFVICSVENEPQMKAVMNNLREGMKEVGIKPLRIEGDYHGGWVLMDYNDVIVHIFREQARGFYDLDGVWADAPAIALDLEEA